MSEKVYIETSFVSVLMARPTKDILQIARQIESQEWWDNHRQGFELITSEAVLLEALRGSESAAERRIDVLRGLTTLSIEPEARSLARRLLQEHFLPEKAAEDALHIAICAINDIQYLLTWNCKHLANAIIRRQIRQFLEREGFYAPDMCTPQELMEKQA